MMVPSDIKKLKKFIASYEWFYIIGHDNPDGDCIGSQLACAGLLQKLNKKVFLLSSGPFSNSIAQLYKSMFYSSSLEIENTPSEDSKVALLCVDTSSAEKLGSAFNSVAHLPCAVIDHHVTGKPYGSVHYIDSKAPANTILIHRLFKEYKIVPSREDAYFILLGLLTDTQFFRFVNQNDPEPFETAAKMVQLGVSPGDIYQQIGYGATFLSRKVIARVLDRAIRVNNNRIILTYIRHDDYLYKDDIPQSYDVYQMLQGTQKTEVVVYIHEEFDSNNLAVCKVGLRSHNKVDVSKIARDFNGGGHIRAAGFSIPEPLKATWNRLCEYFDTLAI